VSMIFPGSRYATTPLVALDESDGRRTLALRRAPATPGVLEHVVVGGERLDQLAARFYGDPTRYWLLLDANPDVLNPFALLESGRRIRVPADRAAPR
jgi:nucleoid-associated protein YgaU